MTDKKKPNTQAKPDATAVRRKAAPQEDPDKGTLNEGSRLPAGMRSVGYEREQYSREMGEREAAEDWRRRMLGTGKGKK